MLEVDGDWACNGSKIPFVGYAIKTDSERFVVLGTCAEQDINQFTSSKHYQEQDY